MTVVIGTAGHIDHGKTTLLRALTGIDADRLPEERRRGMTIDVGYAHLALDDGTELDFVDVPGHDKLVGNMLVGAGEIDAALLVVAADDGPRAQTLEHLALLDALGIGDGVAVVTKSDAVDADRVAEVSDEVQRLLGRTTLATVQVVAVSGVTGEGLEGLRAALVGVRDAVSARSDGRDGGRPTLAIDRVFAVRGRGVVVTGTLRGRRLDRGGSLRCVPGDRVVRVRELQVHGTAVESAGPGRTALNLVGAEDAQLHRGLVLTADPGIVASSRLLVRLRTALPDRTRARLHLGTAAVEAAVGRGGRDAIDLPDGSVIAILRLAEPIAAAQGDRFVLRRSGGAGPVVGGAVLDVEPPRGVSRRRQTVERMAGLAGAIEAGRGDRGRDRPTRSARGGRRRGRRLPGTGRGPGGRRHGDRGRPQRTGIGGIAGGGPDRGGPDDPSRSRPSFGGRGGWREGPGRRRGPCRAPGPCRRPRAIARDGGRAPGPRPAVSDGPPGAVARGPLTAVAGRSRRRRRVSARRDPRARTQWPDRGPRAGSRVRDGRPTASLRRYALALTAAGPLTPAAYRDATGTSRKYVMAILEDLDRRGILRRTDAGHVPGPRAPTDRGPA